MKIFGGNEIYGKYVISTGMVYEMIFSVSKLAVFSFEDKKAHSRVYYFYWTYHLFYLIESKFCLWCIDSTHLIIQTVYAHYRLPGKAF